MYRHMENRKVSRSKAVGETCGDRSFKSAKNARVGQRQEGAPTLQSARAENTVPSRIFARPALAACGCAAGVKSCLKR